MLHAPLEIAGQVALSAYGLRAIGVEASSFSRTHKFKYPVAPNIVPGAGRLPWLKAATHAVLTHDTLHFFFGESFLGERYQALDARVLRGCGWRVVVEFVGSDVRMPSVEAARNPYYVAKEGRSDERALALMRAWNRATHGHAIICDPALEVFVQPHFEHVHVVPFRVDTRRLTPRPPGRDVRRPLLVHAPSDLAGKGTSHVRAAVETLQERGLDFDYRELHGLTNQEVEQVCMQADLVVDQLCVGSHGVFAAEAMSMGKPVVCYLEPDVVPLYPTDLPIINANPATVVDVLGEWLENPVARETRGVESRAYAERIHDVRVVAHRLRQIYDELSA